MEKKIEPDMNRTVVVLHNEGCPATPKTIELVKECVSKLGIPVNVETVLVSTQEEAESRKFLGSPTVQVNGIDIDPSARDRKVFGFM